MLRSLWKKNRSVLHLLFYFLDSCLFCSVDEPEIALPKMTAACFSTDVHMTDKLQTSMKLDSDSVILTVAQKTK